MLLLGVPFFKTAIWIPAIIFIFVANCSYHWCNNHFWVQLPPRGSSTKMKTLLRAAHCDKTKAAGEDNLAHQIITPTSNMCSYRKRQNSGTGYWHLLWVLWAGAFLPLFANAFGEGLDLWAYLIRKEQLGSATHWPFAKRGSRWYHIKPKTPLTKHPDSQIMPDSNGFFFLQEHWHFHPLNYKIRPNLPPLVSVRHTNITASV